MNKKIFIILLIAFFVGLLIGLNTFMNKQTVKMLSVSDTITTNDLNQVDTDGKIIKVTSSNFESEVLNSDKTVLIDFYADWCEPCRTMSPIIEMIAEENNNIKVVKVDVDEETDLAIKYGANSIPTFVVIKDGKEVNRTVGITKKVDLLKLVND